MESFGLFMRVWRPHEVLFKKFTVSTYLDLIESSLKDPIANCTLCSTKKNENTKANIEWRWPKKNRRVKRKLTQGWAVFV